jgi:hypothetical protein
MRLLTFLIGLTLLLFIAFTTYNLLLKASRFRTVEIETNCYATIVTAYYKIKSKHSSEEYFTWMRNLLSLQDCIVVYTTEDLVPQIRLMRPEGFPLEIVTRPLQTFKVAQMLDSDGWAEQEKKDPELSVGHSRELYWIWNEKTSLLHEVTQVNPFKSEYFAWLDIGAIRHSSYNRERLMNNFPFQKGIVLLEIFPFTDEELELKNGTCRADFSKVNRIGGGMIGGEVEEIQKWFTKYYNTMERYLKEGRFLGKDQSVMATSCIESNLCLMVSAQTILDSLWRPTTARDWFYLHKFFRGDVQELPKRQNIQNMFYIS